MKTTYLKTVQRRIAVLDTYGENHNLNEFHILHLYPGKLAYPDGYYDARFFRLIGFNTEQMEKRDLGRHDKIDFWEAVNIDSVRIFADGSTLLQFASPVETVGITQAIAIRPHSGDAIRITVKKEQ